MAEVYLLDSNVLIALATPDHTNHLRAMKWFSVKHRFATCPTTQGALMRFYMRWAERPSIREGKELLRRIEALPGHEFWPDNVNYSDLPERGVLGHRQVTDAYLVLLASKQDGVLATMDTGLAAVHPKAALI